MTESPPLPGAHTTPRPNPYVGPRSFQTGEALFGRDVETADLLDLLIARRVVLLYSPSGAGKTSLIQAGLLPRLAEEGFWTRPELRLSFEATSLPGLAALAQAHGYNRYVFSLLYSLEAHQPAEQRIPPEELVKLSLAEYLDSHRPPPDGAPDSECLIFDQFEEILTTAPTDRPEKESFFQQLGAALQKRSRWALFSIREDYLAALDPYLLYVPTRFSNTFRLDLLGVEAARQAIREPARLNGVDFTLEAAGKLVDDLRKVQVTMPDGSTEVRPGPYIEPMQLQVVCSNLWEKLDPGDNDITPDEVEAIGNVDASLEAYYNSKVGAIARDGSPPFPERQERLVREWFERQLITSRGQRSRVLLEPERSGGLPNALILKLLDTHLVRGEQRGGATWFELAHDRLVRPVRQDNAQWFEAHLSLLQRQAVVWARSGRPDDLLLRGKTLGEGEAWAAAQPVELLEIEQQYLRASQRLAGEEERQRREQELRLEAERLRAEDQARNAARFRRLAVVIALVLLAALILAGASFSLYQQVQSNSKTIQTQSANNEALSAENATRAAQAETQAAVNATNANVAAELQKIAEAAADEAEKQKALAEQQAANALAALSLTRLSDRPDLALLFAAQAYQTADTYQARDSLLTALLSYPRLRRMLVGDFLWSRQLVFSPDGQMLAVSTCVQESRSGSCQEYEVRLWDMVNLEPLGEPIQGSFDYVFSLAFSPDSRILAFNDGPKVILWDVENQKQIGDPIQVGQFENIGAVYGLAFSPDSQILAASSSGSVLLWDVAEGEQIGDALETDQVSIESMAFSPDGQILAGGGGSGSVFVWDVGDRTLLNTLFGLTTIVKGLIFSPDGKTLKGVDWRGNMITWESPDYVIVSREDSLCDALGINISFNQDGNDLAYSCGDSSLHVQFEALNRADVHFEQGFSTRVAGLALSPDGKLLASTGAEQGTVLLWDILDPNTLATQIDQSVGDDLLLKQFSSLAFSPDGGWLAGGVGDAVALYDTNDWRQSESLLGDPYPHESAFFFYPQPVEALAFSPDGALLAFNGCKEVGAHNFCDQWKVILWDLNSMQPISPTLDGSSGYLTYLQFSSDGNILAAGTGFSSQLWDMRDRQPMGDSLELPDFQFGDGLALSPDGLVLAWGGCAQEDSAGCLRGQIELWSLISRQPMGEALTGHADQVTAIAFSQDGKRLASGSQDGTLIFWDLTSRQPVGEIISAQSGSIASLAFSPDGKILASVGEANTLRLWDVEARRSLGLPLPASDPLDISHNLAFSPDSKLLASVDNVNELLLWPVDPKVWLERACQIVGRNFTQAEWAQYFPDEDYRQTCAQWPLETIPRATPMPSVTPSPKP